MSKIPENWYRPVNIPPRYPTKKKQSMHTIQAILIKSHAVPRYMSMSVILILTSTGAQIQDRIYGEGFLGEIRLSIINADENKIYCDSLDHIPNWG